MRKIILVFLFALLFFLQGCAGGPIVGVTLPEVQAFEYKDIVSCVKVDAAPGYSDCKIKVDDGIFITLRVQSSKIPTDPDAPAAPAE